MYEIFKSITDLAYVVLMILGSFAIFQLLGRRKK